MLTNRSPDKSKLFSLNLGDLDFLLDLYETGSLTETAANTDMSLSSASRTLKKLRNTFNDPLFLRSLPRLIPTTKTEALIPDVRMIMNRSEHFTENVVFDPSSLCRTFHIGAVDNALFAVLQNFLKQFFKQAPHASLEFVHLGSRSFELLESGELDGAICPTIVDLPPNFSGLNLYPVSYCICMRKGHPLEKLLHEKGTLTREDISAYRKICISNNATPAQQFYTLDEKTFSGQSWQDIAVTVPYFLSIPAILHNTDLTVTLPTQTAKQFVRDFTGLPITYYPVPDIDTGTSCKTLYHTRFIWHDRSNDDPGMQWLRGLLAAYVKNPEVDPV